VSCCESCRTGCLVDSMEGFRGHEPTKPISAATVHNGHSASLECPIWEVLPGSRVAMSALPRVRQIRRTEVGGRREIAEGAWRGFDSPQGISRPQCPLCRRRGSISPGYMKAPFLAPGARKGAFMYPCGRPRRTGAADETEAGMR